MQTLVFSISLVFMLGLVTPVAAQFIRLNFIVPPESSIIDLTDLPADLFPPEARAEILNSSKSYRWLELRSLENHEMIINWQKERTAMGSINERLLYLNDGTTIFLNAKPFTGNTQTFFLWSKKTKGKSKTDEINSYSAWVGIPEQAKGKLTIIYP